MAIDDVDKDIIRVLNNDARLSYREISQMLNLSVGTVSHRVRRMEDQGVIKGYIPVVSAEKVGFDFRALIFLNIEKGKLQNVEEKLAEFNNLICVYDITGDFDAVIVGRFENRKHLNTFVKEIQTIKYVVRTNTSVVLTVLKESTKVEL